MLGVRAFACESCETVYSGPAEPETCDRCGSDRFADLTATLSRDAYFLPDRSEP
jgi:rubredoxin